jgi:hypothetical protein
MKLTDLYFQIKEEKSTNLAYELQGDLKKSVREIEQAINNSANKKNEVLGTVSSLILALPDIVKTLSKVGKVIAKKLQEKINPNALKASKGEQFFEELGKFADQIKDMYISLINGIIKKFVKDEDKSKKLSILFFHILLAISFTSAGVQSLQNIKSGSINSVLLDAIQAALEGGPGGLLKFFIDGVKSITGGKAIGAAGAATLSAINLKKS